MLPRAQNPPSLPRRLRARLADSRGFSLAEMLVASAMLIVVLGAVSTAVVAASRAHPKITEPSLRIQEARGTLEGITRELRQTYRVVSTASNAITVLTYKINTAAGTTNQVKVRYSCAAGTCSRQEAAVEDSFTGTPRKVIDGISSSDVFSYAPDTLEPESVFVTLKFGVDTQAADVVLRDGVSLRNAINFAD
ncbi:MAG: PulJ/GspJ family protein [Solirubrobacterales bacterium]